MNRIVFLSFSLLLAACAANQVTVPTKPALQLFEPLPDAEEKKTLRGLLQKNQLTQDTTFAWYALNGKFLKPDPTMVSTIAAHANKVQLVLFVGTWCHDSQQLLPKYFKTLEAANFPEGQLTIFGVDRAKTTIGGMHNVFGVQNVPTLIVMQAGKELGRIVEYGTTGMVDKELAELVSRAK